MKQLSKLLIEDDGDDSIFSFDKIWKLKVPPRVRCFLWLLAINRVPTKDFLIKKRGESTSHFACVSFV